MTTYWEKLKDPRWQRRRLEIMDRAEFACESCGIETQTLNVHHKRYRKGADPWDYKDFELACLCELCHLADHRLKDRLDTAISMLGNGQMEILIGYAEALAVSGYEHEINLENAEQVAGAADYTWSLDEDELLTNVNGKLSGRITGTKLVKIRLRNLERARRNDVSA